MKQRSNQNLIIVARWVARIGSIAFIGIILAFLFGEGERLPTLSEIVARGLTFFPGLVVLGMLVGWWKEIVGGAITIIGLGGFYIWDFVLSGTPPNGPFFLLFSLPGILFFLVGVGGLYSGSKPNNSDVDNW